MTPEKKLLAAIFGFSSKEEKAAMAAEGAAAMAAQSEKDWASARSLAEMAGADFPGHAWVPALMYEWQACAVAATENGEVLCAKMFGDVMGHYTLSEWDIENTEVGR